MKKPLNPLIRKKIDDVIDDDGVKHFIVEILDLERDPPPRGNNDRYESLLAKFSREVSTD